MSDDKPKPTKKAADAAIARLRTAIEKGRVEIANAAALTHQAGQERSATMRAFDHERAVGLVIQWSERGTGFGEITIALDRQTGECRIDTEGMGPDFCSRIFQELAKRFQT